MYFYKCALLGSLSLLVFFEIGTKQPFDANYNNPSMPRVKHPGHFQDLRAFRRPTIAPDEFSSRKSSRHLRKSPRVKSTNCYVIVHIGRFVYVEAKLKN